MDPHLVGAVLLALLALDGSLLIGVVVPGDAAIVVAGSALTGPAEIAVAAVAGVIGCFLGATGGWLIGRRYGARVRHSRAGRWIGERRWARAERIATSESGGPALAAAYFLPVVNALTPILAGSLGMPYGRFIRWAVTGSVAWVTTYLVLGSLAGGFVRDNQHLMVPIAACAAILVAGLVVIVRRTRSREAAVEAAEITGPAETADR
ncbi:DedA family protein [Streptosporangium carneum]|uniref:DedA family protein n=1 Tax=Streptosporangium carneum TaxID=47481 RepID=UPI0022F33FB6|nr:DedA family protein [Streptosporangium carneum]